MGSQGDLSDHTFVSPVTLYCVIVLFIFLIILKCLISYWSIVCIYIVVLVSGVQQSHSVIYIYIHLFFFMEKAMAPHSSTLAWKIPWMEEPGGLQSMGSLKVGHD